MKKIKIKREFLEELLDDEVELWNIAHNRGKNELADFYQNNIDRIEILLQPESSDEDGE